MSIQQYQADSKKIRLKCDFIDFPAKQSASDKYRGKKKIPAKDQNNMIESDEKRLKQVLINL